jgi:hypothetical protein
MAACANFSPSANTSIASGSADAPDMVWFTGASNIRQFACGSTRVTVLATAAPAEFERTHADGLPAIRSAALAIPVVSLDCGIAKMNRDLVETLGSDTSATIHFRLWNYVVLRRNVPGWVRMNGLLTLAGRQKMMDVYGTVVADRSGRLRLRGERLIDVRDFGIKPPTRFLGLLHVANEVIVHFDIAVRPLIDPLGILVSAGSVPGTNR